MPKETYFNISAEKRERIFNAALEEFTKYNYKDASITRIVETLGIAKGSIYKYFENKKEMYFYLIKEVGHKKLDYLRTHLVIENQDFFETLRSVLYVGTNYDIEFSKNSLFLSRVFMENNDPFENLVTENMKQMSLEFIKDVFHKGLINGQVRNDIDIDLMVFYVNEIITNFGQFIIKKNNLEKINFINNIKDEETKVQIFNYLDNLIDLFKNGIKILDKSKI